jgi:hypothetical protein
LRGGDEGWGKSGAGGGFGGLEGGDGKGKSGKTDAALVFRFKLRLLCEPTFLVPFVTAAVFVSHIMVVLSSPCCYLTTSATTPTATTEAGAWVATEPRQNGLQCHVHLMPHQPHRCLFSLFAGPLS